MTDSAQNIEQQIDETKASLVGKLEALENQVAEAVQATTETVSETVGAVKETVETVKEKVHNAGQIFNLKQHAERYPWLVFGGSVAAGCLASYMFGGDSKRPVSRRRESVDRRRFEDEKIAESKQTPAAASRAEAPAEKPEEKHGWLREQLGSLSGLAVGVLMGSLRDLAARNVSDGLGKTIAQELDRLTTQMGGKPIVGPVISPPSGEPVTPQPSQAAAFPPKQPAPRPAVASAPKQPAF